MSSGRSPTSGAPSHEDVPFGSDDGEFRSGTSSRPAFVDDSEWTQAWIDSSTQGATTPPIMDPTTAGVAPSPVAQYSAIGQMPASGGGYWELPAQEWGVRADTRMLSALAQGHTALQQDHTALKQGHTALQQDHTALQQGHTALQQDHTALQQSHTTLQQGHTQLLTRVDEEERNRQQQRQKDLEQRKNEREEDLAQRVNEREEYLKQRTREEEGHQSRHRELVGLLAQGYQARHTELVELFGQGIELIRQNMGGGRGFSSPAAVSYRAHAQHLDTPTPAAGPSAGAGAGASASPMGRGRGSGRAHFTGTAPRPAYNNRPRNRNDRQTRRGAPRTWNRRAAPHTSSIARSASTGTRNPPTRNPPTRNPPTARVTGPARTTNPAASDRVYSTSATQTQYAPPPEASFGAPGSSISDDRLERRRSR